MFLQAHLVAMPILTAVRKENGPQTLILSSNAPGSLANGSSPDRKGMLSWSYMAM